MLDTGLGCYRYSVEAGDAINRLKLCGLRGARMGHSYELNKCVTGGDTVEVRRGIKSIPDDRFASLRQFLFAAGANQGTHLVSSRD